MDANRAQRKYLRASRIMFFRIGAAVGWAPPTKQTAKAQRREGKREEEERLNDLPLRVFLRAFAVDLETFRHRDRLRRRRRFPWQ